MANPSSYLECSQAPRVILCVIHIYRSINVRLNNWKARDNAGSDVVAWKGTTDGSFSVALNCDAAVIQLGNQSTCGRVIRDHNVAFLCSFHAKIGSCSVIYAELWPFSWASNWLGLVGLRFVLIQSR
ncbi:hypothetical protein JHK87_026007 [Glycine soja]|nr:hypothetical protein JHK87_026007 [Glycine soja]